MKKHLLLKYLLNLIILIQITQTKVLSQPSPGSAALCQNNINCPDFSAYDNIKRSVVYYSFSYPCTSENLAGCSGVVLNNPNYDGAIYLLTAAHCVNTSDEAASMVVYWNYEQNCLGDGLTTYTSSDCELLATSTDLDFTLIKINDPPTGYNIVYAGWDVTNYVSLQPPLFTIHHPKQDYKKIALSGYPATTSQDGFPLLNECTPAFTSVPQSMWKIRMSDGTPEIGSSGSPVFNNKSRVVGDCSDVDYENTVDEFFGSLLGSLYFNPLTCTSSSIRAYYQKLSYNWAYHSEISKQLKHWLDSDGSNVLKLDGYDPNGAEGAYWTATNSYEPNNTIIQAEDVFPTLTTNFTGFLRSYIQLNPDEDFFKLKLSGKGFLTLRLNELPKDYNLYLYDSSGNEIGKSTNSGEDEDVIEDILLDNTVVYAKITGESITHSIFERYRLNVDWKPCGDTYEPNNSISNAKPIISQPIGSTSILTTVGSYISTSTDHDWWSIPIDGSGQLKLTLFNLPFDYQLELRSYQGTVLKESIKSLNTGTTNEVITYSYDIAEPTDLYAIIYPNGSASSVCLDYSLRLEWTPNAPCQAVTLTPSITAASSGSAGDGSISITASGGQEPYIYAWENGASTAAISGLEPNTYEVTVTGADGCKKTAEYVVGVQGQTQPPYCSGTTTFSASSGTFSDGSDGSNYQPNSNCRWKISVPNAIAIIVNFNVFDLAAGDVVKVYDGPTTASPLLKTFNAGSDLEYITSSSGTVLVQFISNSAEEAEGWEIHYQAQFSSAEDGVKINGYEYWFDNDFDNRQSQIVTPQSTLNLDIAFNTDGLIPGLHSLLFRFFDSDGQVSVVTTDLFLKTEVDVPGNRKIVEYEYWFDNQFEERLGQDVPFSETFNWDELVDVADLADGLHSIQTRYRDDLGQWSAITTDLFLKIAAVPSVRKIVGYEYWFDNQFEARLNQDAPFAETFNWDGLIDVADLADGLHSIQTRFKDDVGEWTTITTDLFLKIAAVPSVRKIVGYEYWFDNQFEALLEQDAPFAETFNWDELIDVADLADGLHSIQTRFRDDLGQWTAITTDLFLKVSPSQFDSSTIVGIEWWFDEDFNNRTMLPVAPPIATCEYITSLAAQHLVPGEHTVHFRFKDNFNQWSVVTEDVFNVASEPLPIKLLYIRAQATKENQGLISWETATETNNDYFQVEHSLNGINFKTIGRVQGHGTTLSSNYYQFIHEKPAPSINYYRLRQVDYDSRYEYSKIVSLLIESNEIQLYPNPTTGIVLISGEMPTGTIYKVADSIGKIIQNGIIDSQSIDLSAQPSGMYFISLYIKNHIVIKRIIKQ